ncbi:hypothetical protein GWK47_021808 [Chionoecetes opilio]|uniref:Uncharacterized protein n=1 Tax=Chionoecetes opilio TaxID=41210 RepID=A0A8J5CGJ4_CHIOP|nr:hypothetical protein GWK47_021808 [Chionoecetes opilio]
MGVAAAGARTGHGPLWGQCSPSRYDQTAHNLEPLTPGLRTRIQNPGSGRWDRTGTVLESTAPRQYLMRLDGSGRTTIRNRRHLCPLTAIKSDLRKGTALVIQSWTDTAHHNWPLAQLPSALVVVRGVTLRLPTCGAALVVVVPAFGMAAATAARSRSATKSVASWAARTEPLLGETASKERASATALLPLRPCAAEVGERSGFPRHRGGGGGVGRKHGSPRRRRGRFCGEDPPAVRIRAELGSVQKRSAEVDVENRRSFSLALMTLFDIGHADAFALITVERGSAVPVGQRCPDGPRCIMQGKVDQSLADRERRRLERGVLKRSSSTGACHDCHAQLIGLRCRRRRRKTVVTTDGTRTSFRAQEYPLNRPVPPSVAGTPIMGARVSPLRGTAQGSRTAPQFIFSPLSPAPTPLPLAAPCGATGGRAREKMAKEIKAEMTGGRSRTRRRPKPLDDPVDGADKIIATCHALLKEKQPRDDYREMVQLTIIVLGGEVEANTPEAGRLPPCSMDGKGDLHSQDHPLPRGSLRPTKHEKRE